MAEKGSNAVPVNEEGESIPEISFNNEEVGESTAKTAQSFPLEEEHSAQQAALPIWRFMIIIAGLCLGLFLALMDLSIISTALYTISIDFSDYKMTIWAALSYILADVGCAVFFTRLADVYGRKPMMLTSFLFFTVFSLACGFAQTSTQLVVFRTLQGIGGTGLYALTMVICPEISPPRFLPFVVGTLGLTAALAGVCGPVVGGVITGTTTWRWIFWINVPIGGLAIIILLIVWPSVKNITDVAASSSLNQLDFFGAFLMAVGSVCFVFCLQELGTRDFLWSSAATISLLVVSSLAWAGLFLWEWYISRGKISSWILPQLPWRIVKHRPMAMAILSTLLTGYVQFGAVFSIPLRAQIVDLEDPVKSGLSLLPLVAATAVGSLVGGGASAGKNITFWTMTIATALMIVGTGLLTTLPLDGTKTISQNGWEVILGFGLGMTVSTATFMTSMEVEFVDHAVAQGTVAQARILGGAIAIGVTTIVMNNHIQTSLTGIVSDEILKIFYIAPFSVQGRVPTIALIKFRESYIDAFKQDMMISMYVAVGAFVTSLATWQSRPPTVKERSEELARAVKAYQEGKTTATGIEPMMDPGEGVIGRAK